MVRQTLRKSVQLLSFIYVSFEVLEALDYEDYYRLECDAVYSGSYLLITLNMEVAGSLFMVYFTSLYLRLYIYI